MAVNAKTSPESANRRSKVLDAGDIKEWLNRFLVFRF